MLDVLETAPETSDQGAILNVRSAHSDSQANAVVAGKIVARRQVLVIIFRDLGFAYGAGKPVLHSLSLHIAAGRTVGIVGTSGSGKSSLARLLLRLAEPQEGSILLDGIPIDTLPIDELRSMVAVVPQDTALFNDTIAFNIGVGRIGAPHSEIEHAARIARLHDFIASLPEGYDTVVGERGLRLSGGERQRLAIARAVLKQPLVYVFDEATSMLDSRSERGDHDALLARAGAYARLWHAMAR
jgi:ATP-binding cassette, subfamily B, bacterial